jgi:hypothetical protein
MLHLHEMRARDGTGSRRFALLGFKFRNGLIGMVQQRFCIERVHQSFRSSRTRTMQAHISMQTNLRGGNQE